MRCEVYIEINHEPCRDPILAERVLAALHREERSVGPSAPCESTDVVSGLWIIELPPRLAYRVQRDRQIADSVHIGRQITHVVVELP